MNKTGVIDQITITDEIRVILNETTQVIDDTTHEVLAWAEYIACLLEYLEFFAMANDPYYPEQYELMLTRLKDRVASRVKRGTW